MSLLSRQVLHFNAVRLLRVRLREIGLRKASEGCSKESCASPPPPSTESCCPQPSPCPSPPICPPRLCPQNPDPGNPCNYCPPPCGDGPDLTKLKKFQCQMQEDDDVPVFLKKGTSDVMLYHGTVILVVVNTVWVIYLLCTS